MKVGVPGTESGVVVGAMPRTTLAKSVTALSMSWSAELTSAFDMGGGVARLGGTLGEPRWSGELERRLMGRSFVGGVGTLSLETVGVFMLEGRSLAIWSSCEIGLRRSIEREEF